MTSPTAFCCLFLAAALSLLSACSESDSASKATAADAKPDTETATDTTDGNHAYRTAPRAPLAKRSPRPDAPGKASRFEVTVDPSKIDARSSISALSGNPSISTMPGFGLPAGIGEPREFFHLSEYDRREFARIEAELWESSDVGEQARILEELEDYYGKDLIAVAERMLNTSDDPELRARAVNLLNGNTSGQALDFLYKAAKDNVPTVRAEAYYAAGHIRDPRLVAFLENGFRDESNEVRWAAMEVAESTPERSRLETFRRALTAPHTDVMLWALDALEMEGSQRGIEILFSALDSTDKEVREQAQWSVEWMIDQRFDNAAQARAWWAKSRNSYDKDLVYLSE